MTGKQCREEHRGEIREKIRRDTVFFSTAVLEWGVHSCLRLLLAAILSGVVILGDKAPLGVAMTAASGAGLLGGGAVLGACLGSLCQLELGEGMRYASASLLTYAAAFAFYDIKFLRKAWTLPLAAGGTILFTALVAHHRLGWTQGEQIGLLLEVGITMGAVWCFRAALRFPGVLSRGMSREQRGGLLVLLAALLGALEPLNVLGLSLGRCLAGAVTLGAAWLGGGSAGAVWGAVLGLGLDLTGERGLSRTALFALAGLAAGVREKRNARVIPALSWLLTALIAAAWWGELESGVVCAGEGLCSALIFLAVPAGVLRRGEGLVTLYNVGKSVDPGGVERVRERLHAAAGAYRTLCTTLKESLHLPENDGDISLVFDRAADRVCRGCGNRELCWQREYAVTFGALNDATAAMVERGRIRGEDLPAFFAHRCIHLPDFISGVNEELTALFCRRQYKARIRESRETVCRQYEQLSHLLWETAEELGEEWITDRETEKTVRRWVGQRGLHVEVKAFRDGRGLLRVQVEGTDAPRFAGERSAAELSAAVGKNLRVEREGERLVAFVELEPFKALAGVASRKKDGETVSGDAGTYFKRPDGKVYLLLCDGMGSGEAAGRESGLAVRLLEEFLMTGIPAQNALCTLASALALRGEETGGFTTVDLLEVDLFTGESALYKMGAAPTYVRQGECLRRLEGSALPAGLTAPAGEGVDRFPLRLSAGDWVLMISDGVCPDGKDDWLLEQLRQFRGDSPKELAAKLVAGAGKQAADDSTALLVKLEKRT